jgi:hypothetical protein
MDPLVGAVLAGDYVEAKRIVDNVDNANTANAINATNATSTTSASSASSASSNDHSLSIIMLLAARKGDIEMMQFATFHIIELNANHYCELSLACIGGNVRMLTCFCEALVRRKLPLREILLGNYDNLTSPIYYASISSRECFEWICTQTFERSGVYSFNPMHVAAWAFNNTQLAVLEYALGYFNMQSLRNFALNRVRYFSKGTRVTKHTEALHVWILRVICNAYDAVCAAADHVNEWYDAAWDKSNVSIHTYPVMHFVDTPPGAYHYYDIKWCPLEDLTALSDMTSSTGVCVAPIAASSDTRPIGTASVDATSVDVNEITQADQVQLQIWFSQWLGNKLNLDYIAILKICERVLA